MCAKEANTKMSFCEIVKTGSNEKGFEFVLLIVLENSIKKLAVTVQSGQTDRLTLWYECLMCVVEFRKNNQNKFETNGIFRQKAEIHHSFSPFFFFFCRHTSVQLCIHHNFAENNGSCFFFFIVQRWVCMHVKTNS